MKNERDQQSKQHPYIPSIPPALHLLDHMPTRQSSLHSTLDRLPNFSYSGAYSKVTTVCVCVRERDRERQRLREYHTVRNAEMGELEGWING